MKFNTVNGLAVAALLIAAPFSAATAADMAVKAPPVAPAPACNWCGWYLGVNAGWIGSTGNTISNTGTDTDGGGFGALLNGVNAGNIPAALSLKESGFIGGAQLGYNWQLGNSWIGGWEADFDGTSAKKSASFPIIVAPPDTTSFNRAIDWLSTIRGRLGVLALPNLLLYVTGGLAVGEVKIGAQLAGTSGDPPPSSEPTTTNTTTTTRAGGTVGGGVEWMFAPHWSLKAEYLYVNLGTTSNTIVYTYPVNNTSSLTSSVRNAYNVARAGVNWHF
jgi:outer membrane immunogenic protein